MNFLFIGMAEELAFRGLIQGYLLTRLRGYFLGVSTANWITAALFAWIHNFYLDTNLLPWMSFTFPMGLVYGIIREKTGNWTISGISHGLMIPSLYAFAKLGALEMPSD
jgi:membrane protease YdiL (CAAX protease family)